MQITSETVREFFDTPRAYRETHSDRIEIAMRLRDQATKVTAQVTGMPHGGGQDRATLLAAMIDAETTARDFPKRIAKVDADVEYFISLTPLDDVTKQILRDRYIGLKLWTDIFNSVELSKRQVYRKHENAMFDIAVWLSNEPRDSAPLRILLMYIKEFI